MSRSALLDAVDTALECLTSGSATDFRHLSPPAETVVVKDNPLSQQVFHHFRHFRHLESGEPDHPPHSSCNARSGAVADDDAQKLARRVSLLSDSCGESGEMAKSLNITVTYLSPPDAGAVANAGECGESHPAGVLANADHRLARGRPSPRHDTLNRWPNAHPPPLCPHDRCAHCGGPVDARASDAVAVLRAIDPTSHLWLHLRCHPVWYAQRIEPARAAFATGDLEGTPT